jgi:ABC-type nitrate/sulfonate/bicarbonate transport system substrate-binding protein
LRALADGPGQAVGQSGVSLAEAEEIASVCSKTMEKQRPLRRIGRARLWYLAEGRGSQAATVSGGGVRLAAPATSATPVFDVSTQPLDRRHPIARTIRINGRRTEAGRPPRGGEIMLKVWCRALALVTAACAFAVSSFPAAAQQRPKIVASSLTLPVFNPLVWNIMKARGFDAKHGFELEAKPYPSISAFYAGFVTGETDVLIGGPTILQKFYLEGVPLRIFGTAFTLSDLMVFAKDDKIKSLADLKGKQLAADMGGSQFQVLKIYTATKGIELGKDITVVNANFAVARAQLEADRVEAALVIEPLASIIMRQNPTWKVIFNGAEGWREITGQDGWEIVPAIRADTIQRVPNAPKMLLAALKDVADVMHKESDSADKIAAETVKLPPGILKAAVEGKRLHMIVEPAWEPATRKSILDMMERAVKAGFYQKMPDDKIIYAP